MSVRHNAVKEIEEVVTFSQVCFLAYLTIQMDHHLPKQQKILKRLVFTKYGFKLQGKSGFYANSQSACMHEETI